MWGEHGKGLIYVVQSNNGKGECWLLGFAVPRVTELLDLIACFVSVVPLYTSISSAVQGCRTGHNHYDSTNCHRLPTVCDTVRYGA